MFRHTRTVSANYRLKAARQVRAYLMVRLLLNVAAWLSATFSILSLADAFWALPQILRLVLLLLLLLLILTTLTWQLSQLSKKVSRTLRLMYQSYPGWLAYPPEEITDVIAGRIVSSEPWSVAEREQFFRTQDRGLEHLPRSAVRKILFSLNDYLIYLAALISVVLCLIAHISPLYFLRNREFFVPEDHYRLVPPPGTYFYAQPLEIRVDNIRDNYTFIGFELLLENNSWQRIETSPLLRIPALAQAMHLRLVFRQGIRKLYSKPVLYETVAPGSFKAVLFRIIPPAFTKQEAWQSEDYFMKLHYGSRVSVAIRHSTGSRVWYRDKLLPVNGEMSRHEFIFTSTSRQEIIYRLLDERSQSELFSPTYTLEPQADSQPLARIYLPQPHNFEVWLPVKGTLTFEYQVEDDYGFKEVNLVLRNERNQIIKRDLKPATQSKDGRIFGRGNASINLEELPGNVFFLQVGVRDNSLIPSSFPWEKKATAGQVGLSQTITIQVAATQEQVAAFEAEQAGNLAERMNELAALYRESEKQLRELAGRARSGEDVTAELKEWVAERSRLQQAARNLQNAIRQQDNKSSPEEIIRREQALEQTSKLLEENIAQREKELQKLLENFPVDFEQANEEVKKISREEYLASLEKSIEDLKRIVELKKLRELENRLNKEIRELDRLAREQLKNPSGEQNQKDIQQHYRRLQQMQTDFRHSDKMAMPPAAMQQHEKAGRDYANSTENSEKINALKEMRAAVADWRNKIRQERNRQGAAEYERAAARLKIAALRVNSIAEVWQTRLEQTGELRGPQTVEKMKRLGQDAANLRNSFRAELSSLAAELGTAALWPPELLKESSETESSFDKLLQTVEKNQPFLFQDRAGNLRWRLNRYSLELMKSMEKMRMQAANMAGAGAGEQLSEGAGEQQSLREDLQKLGDSQSAKDGSLSAAEQAYLESLAARQQELAKRLEEILRQKNLLAKDQVNALEDLAQELKQNSSELKEIRQANELQQQIQKTDELREKFLAARKSVKQREEKQPEREAQAAREYRLEAPLTLPAAEKQPQRKITISTENLTETQRIFYRRFLENLEQHR